MPKILVLCSKPGAHCAVCHVQAMKRNRLIRCLYLHTKANKYEHIDLHVPCMGVFLVYNPGVTLKVVKP